MRGCQTCGLQPEEKPWERGQCKRHALSGQGMLGGGGGGGGSADGVCRVDCMGLRVGTVQKTDLTWVAVTLLGWGEGGGLGVRHRHRAPAGPSVRHGGVTATG